MTWQFWVVWIISLLFSSLLGALVVRKTRERGIITLSVLLAIYVVSANILVPRLVHFTFLWQFVLVTGSIVWPFIAQLTDMINEIYGRKAALFAAAMAYAANLMFVIFTWLSLQTVPLWDAPQETWFRLFFGTAWRPFLASLCSYTAANWADITLFSWLKRKYFKREEGETIEGEAYKSNWEIVKFSTLRSATSDMLNMIIDNVVFYTIAFIGTMPGAVLIHLIASSMLAKVILSQIDLPFYLMFRFLTKDVKREM